MLMVYDVTASSVSKHVTKKSVHVFMVCAIASLALRLQLSLLKKHVWHNNCGAYLQNV